MSRRRVGVIGLLLLAPAAWAQAPDSTAAPVDSAQVVADLLAARALEARRARLRRAAWLGDRVPLAVGDLLTIVVNERTRANESVSNVATARRSQKAQINPQFGGDVAIGPTKGFESGLANESRDVGQAGRAGDFTSVLTVRVVSVAPNGVAEVRGAKKVSLDGRVQDLSLTGFVRAEDVDVRNQVSSDALADVVITYKGKKIGPRSGILGNILNLLWP